MAPSFSQVCLAGSGACLILALRQRLCQSSLLKPLLKTSGAALGVCAWYASYLLLRHARKTLKTGSPHATPAMHAHPSWHAVVDNYVYVHNAFRNDLAAMIEAAERGRDMAGRLGAWREALAVHSRLEDEIFLPALRSRVGEGRLPASLTTGEAHEAVEQLLEAASAAGRGQQPAALWALRDAACLHFAEEEREVMPLMLEHFTERELWAMDSFIVNPKLGYCPQQVLVRITLWWLANTSLGEGLGFLKNLVRSGQQPKMSKDFWVTIQALIPALQNRPVEDLVA